MTSVTWTCPRCSRRVPNRAATCHCGATREEAEAALVAAPPAPGAELGWDVKAPAFGLLAVAVFAVGWLLFAPYHPAPIQPVLGFANVSAPPPTTTLPRRPVPPPPFKLPWWK